MKLFITIFSLTTLSVFAQNKGDFSLEFDVNQIRYENTESINRYLKDTSGYYSQFFGKQFQNDSIKHAPIYGLSLNFQPLNFMSFGVYGSYQYNSFNRPFTLVSTIQEPGGDLDFVISNQVHKVTSSCVMIGASTTLYLNKLLKLDQSSNKVLNRVQFGIGLKGGIAMNNLEVGSGTNYFYVQNIQNGHQYDVPLFHEMRFSSYRSTSFAGAFELKLGYRIIDSKLFSTIGMKVGYQFHTSKVMTNRAGGAFEFENDKMALHFGGLYYGIYLNIGK